MFTPVGAGNPAEKLETAYRGYDADIQESIVELGAWREPDAAPIRRVISYECKHDFSGERLFVSGDLQRLRAIIFQAIQERPDIRKCPTQPAHSLVGITVDRRVESNSRHAAVNHGPDAGQIDFTNSIE
jgi:hypothetical protein